MNIIIMYSYEQLLLKFQNEKIESMRPKEDLIRDKQILRLKQSIFILLNSGGKIVTTDAKGKLLVGKRLNVSVRM